MTSDFKQMMITTQPIQTAPRSHRLHIGIFGLTNSGKSTLLNMLTGQQAAMTSPIAGTTTDVVLKAMEVHGLGPVLWLDTPGFADDSSLGALRLEKTEQALTKSEFGIYLLSSEPKQDLPYIRKVKAAVPGVLCISRFSVHLPAEIEDELSELGVHAPLLLPDLNNIGSDEQARLRETILEALTAMIGGQTTDRPTANRPTANGQISDGQSVDIQSADGQIMNVQGENEISITANLVGEKSLVLLVMPQDSEAPKGRLIMPQVQTIRELLDKKAIVVLAVLETLPDIIGLLGHKPDLVITDSQWFKQVHEMLPSDWPLTSFSVLFSAYKGDIDYFIASAKVLAGLQENARILIAEACTHPPLSEDIGTKKIPALLRRRYGEGLQIDFTRGDDFVLDQPYDLIIHCGACLFRRSYVMKRVGEAKQRQIPMTNYGVVLAYLNGILDEVVRP